MHHKESGVRVGDRTEAMKIASVKMAKLHDVAPKTWRQPNAIYFCVDLFEPSAKLSDVSSLPVHSSRNAVDEVKIKSFALTRFRPNVAVSIGLAVWQHKLKTSNENNKIADR